MLNNKLTPLPKESATLWAIERRSSNFMRGRYADLCSLTTLNHHSREGCERRTVHVASWLDGPSPAGVQRDAGDVHVRTGMPRPSGALAILALPALMAGHSQGSGAIPDGYSGR